MAIQTLNFRVLTSSVLHIRCMSANPTNERPNIYTSPSFSPPVLMQMIPNGWIGSGRQEVMVKVNQA
eukprot:577510-Amorphochlora_amoeboformis.AAC.2